MEAFTTYHMTGEEAVKYIIAYIASLEIKFRIPHGAHKSGNAGNGTETLLNMRNVV